MAGRRAFVITLALTSCTRAQNKPPADETGTKTEEREGSYTEFRNGRCVVVPDCTPPPGTNLNPCNPPPPQVVVECPADMLPTQPPGTQVSTNPDGTCWVECDEKLCDAPGPLRVRCPAPGEKPPEYASALIVPPATSAKYPSGTFVRNEDMTCDLVEPTRTSKHVPCPPELVPKVATGVVPVLSSKTYLCQFGRVPVACPKRFHVWH